MKKSRVRTYSLDDLAAILTANTCEQLPPLNGPGAAAIMLAALSMGRSIGAMVKCLNYKDAIIYVHSIACAMREELSLDWVGSEAERRAYVEGMAELIVNTLTRQAEPEPDQAEQPTERPTEH